MSATSLESRFGVTDVVAYVNPEAHNAAGVHEQIKGVEDCFGVTVEIFESEARATDTHEKFLDELAPRLGQKTLVLVKGGDGQAHLWNELLQSPETPDEARRTLTLYCANGNKCDNAFGLNAKQLLQQPRDVLASPQARIATIYPMQVTFQVPEGERTRNVLSYFGIGASGSGAAAIDIAKIGFRDLISKHRVFGKVAQRALEPAVVLQAGWVSPTFTLHDTDDPKRHGAAEQVLELLVRNGPRMAGYETSHNSLEHQQVAISTAQTQAKGAWRSANIITNGLRLATKTLPTEAYNLQHGARSWEITDIEEGVLYGQADGESFVVAEGPVTIKPGAPLRVITTKPHSHRI